MFTAKQEALFRRAERVLRVTRQRVFDMEDRGEYWKAKRMIGNCQRILGPKWKAHNEDMEYAKGQRLLYTWA